MAWEYLRAYGPGSVAGLVIVDQSPCDFAWEGSDLGGMSPGGLLAGNERLQTDQAASVAEFCPAMLHEPDEATVAWMTEEIMQVPPVIATTVLYDEALRDYREFLPQINVPTLVTWGEDDKFYGPKIAHYVAEHIPGARLQMFARSAHCPFWGRQALQQGRGSICWRGGALSVTVFRVHPPAPSGCVRSGHSPC